MSWVGWASRLIPRVSDQREFESMGWWSAPVFAQSALCWWFEEPGGTPGSAGGTPNLPKTTALRAKSDVRQSFVRKIRLQTMAGGIRQGTRLGSQNAIHPYARSARQLLLRDHPRAVGAAGTRGGAAGDQCAGRAAFHLHKRIIIAVLRPRPLRDFVVLHKAPIEISLAADA